MTRIILKNCLCTVATLVVLAMSSTAFAQTGFVWADKPTAPSYTPSPRYAYNSSGGAVQVLRLDKGEYRVVFAGLGGSTRPGGNVQVTAYSTKPLHCNVANWNSAGADFIVDIGCFNPDGKRVNGRFSALVGWWGQ